MVNPSPWKFTLALNMTPGFDLWVLEDGVTIWSQHTCFFMYGSSVIVEPGETLQYDYVWDMRDYEGNLVGPGEYEVRSVIYGGGENVSTGITIVPEPVTLGILLLTSGLLLRKKPTSASR